MSVLRCDRAGCGNIMCNYVSPEYGYLCYDCLNELIEGGSTSVPQFMDSPVTNHKTNDPNWEEYCRNTFEMR